MTLKKNRWANRENRHIRRQTTNVPLLFNLKRAREIPLIQRLDSKSLTKTTTKMIRQSNVMYFIILIFTTNDNIWEISTEETTKKKSAITTLFQQQQKKWIAVINNNRVSERRGKKQFEPALDMYSAFFSLWLS